MHFCMKVNIYKTKTHISSKFDGFICVILCIFKKKRLVFIKDMAGFMIAWRQIIRGYVHSAVISVQAFW